MIDIVSSGYEVSKIYGKDLRFLENVGCCINNAFRGCVTAGSSVNFVRNELEEGKDDVLKFGDIIVKFKFSIDMMNALLRYRHIDQFVYVAENTDDFIEKSLDKVKKVYTGESSDLSSLRFKVVKPYLCDEESEEYEEWKETMEFLEGRIVEMLWNGSSSYQEIARLILPGCFYIEMHLKGNFQAWKHLLAVMINDDSNLQLRDDMRSLVSELQSLIPTVFSDVSCVKSKKIVDPYIQDSWDYDGW